jgi:hypothetical protein
MCAYFLVLGLALAEQRRQHSGHGGAEDVAVPSDLHS